MSTKRPPYKLLKGDFCYVHAMSPIFSEYFEEFGNPLIKDWIPSACFEGKIVKTPFPLGKQTCASDGKYHIEVTALNKAGSIFEAEIGLLRDSQYFSRDIAEPEGWVIQSRLTMENLYKNQANFISKTLTNKLTTPSVPAQQMVQPLSSFLSPNVTITNIQETQDYEYNNDGQFFELDNEEDNNAQLEDDTQIDNAVDITAVFVETNTTFGNESLAWEGLNTRFEKKFDRGATIKIRPSDNDLDAVITFIADVKGQEYKELGNIWLFKFQSFIDADRTEPTVLRPRTPSLRTNFFINGQSQTMPTPDESSDTTAVATSDNISHRYPSRVIDLKILDGGIVPIPELRSEDKFTSVRVNYNELEYFFKTAEKKTRFENLYDLLCVAACNTMYVDNPR
jgi:hypothetical protein